MRIIVICEGQTEQVFCQRTIAPFLSGHGNVIQAPTIKHTGGGIVSWKTLKKQIETHLKSDSNAVVTTFIDYYGLYEKFDYPGWKEAEKIPNKFERIQFLENSMRNDIDQNLRYRFIPYLQLHEFEGLLFNSIDVFKEQIPEQDLIGIEELESVFRDYENPELINNTKDNAPSKRLQRIISGYHKVVYGDILAEAIGIINIKNKCPRFSAWLTHLESL